ncbi:GGDEF domain-containing protein [Acetobacter sp. TBRC 12305]|uniref:diguanylate cyclase n=1 Tax=Acetobacter garciniae TaxID=2817435 RepID=A0A939HPE4_9PROT|nr:GGDEF domain-containing protein [Acetobacter garciniae]MBO1326166.1 GGDEF domain-containing protein [Acetobacter garciniae]MBX0345090.1 GGDEF domain-containing protein [Acetobacter garciniae]
MLSVTVLLPVTWLPIWFQDRQHKAVFWSMIAALTFGGSMICRVALPFLPAIAIANAGVLIAHSLIWMACRSLRKRPPVFGLIVTPAIIWLGLCLLRSFQADVNLRVFVFGLLAAILNGLAMREVWLIRRGSRVVKGWLLGVLGIEGIVKLAWGIWALTQPVDSGLVFSAIPGFIPMLVGITGFILLLGPALVALDKELSDLRQHDAARQDFMTGVGNRRYLEETLEEYFDRAVQRGQPLSLIMVDADRFKEYNDLYGHPAGDRCLQALVGVLKLCCRSGDVVGRYGGEEFAVLLPQTGAKGALALAQRMLAEVRALRLEHARAPNGIVTISLGVASTHDTIAQMTPASLIKMADLALYNAKHEGRDRASMTVPEGTVPPNFHEDGPEHDTSPYAATDYGPYSGTSAPR